MTAGNNNYQYVFGPVPSRRLGFSLGIDPVPFKTCSYDCIYCQLGRTTDKTTTRKEFIPVKEILKEVKLKLDENIKIDYITLSGSGEPTLYSALDQLIVQIQKLTSKPVAVLTNGSLLWDKNIQKSLEKADLVIPSLDAGNENLFRYVNRPCGDLNFNQVINGLVSFAEKCRQKIWLEVCLLNGVTSIKSEVIRINTIIRKIKPAKVQINTVKRPPAESFAFPVPAKQMQALAGCINGNCEIIADFNRSTDTEYHQITKKEIINLLKRRPCTLEDISGGLNLHKNEILKYMDELMKCIDIVTYDHNHSLYYSMK